MGHHNHLYFLMISVLTLTACDKRPDVEVLEQRFYQHHAQFNALANIACSIKADLNTPYFRYYIHTEMEREPYLKPRLEQLKHNPNFQPHLEQLDQLLHQIDVDVIVLQQNDSHECSIFVPEWDISFAGKGTSLSYTYQPAKLADYNADVFFQGDPDTIENSHFTKPLADGWYIEYQKYSSALSKLREQAETNQ
ncbi:hypothetical protein Q3O60_14275 [Alkalimonas collagenimarina]|uniref:Lipoprotein n=1 Tax=Alkalimonas collagenimarina TaxID=400390 RepID=A0ABT9H223_9GAMM|nr:hypothetical protein [Alkalimonas collagenimarina]MDP4537356.1 hypothetical protein [Alkalimonas collagenimarina]